MNQSRSAGLMAYSGKEEQDAVFGIAYSDFGARLYDRSAAWTAIDPLAEKYFSVSPYTYCNNNTVKLADTDGQVVHIAIGAAIGAAVNGGIAAIQGKSPQEIRAAAAGGAVAGAIGGFIGGKGVGTVLKRIEGKVASHIEKKYASESVKATIQEEVKKEYKAADKVFGPATKKSIKKAVSVRIETLAGTEKAINSMVNKVAVDTQQSLVDEGANYYIHLFNENGDD